MNDIVAISAAIEAYLKLWAEPGYALIALLITVYIIAWISMLLLCLGSGAFYVKRGTHIRHLSTSVCAGAAMILAIASCSAAAPLSLLSIIYLIVGTGFVRYAAQEYRRAEEQADLAADYIKKARDQRLQEIAEGDSDKYASGEKPDRQVF